MARAPEVTTHGSVALRSGLWDWRASPDGGGTTLRFRHATRPRDELRIWVADPDMTAERAREAALEPVVVRTWEDVDGFLWRVSLELSTTGRAGDSEQEVWLVFRSGAVQARLQVPADTVPARLTHSELIVRLRDALAR